MTTKICRSCGDAKPIAQFYADARLRDGVAASCKPCCSAASSESYRARVSTPEGRAEHSRRTLESRRGNPAKILWTSAKRRAANLGVAFDLAVSDVTIPPVCPVLNIELSMGGEDWGSSPSIDRLDPSRGYVPENIRVISFRANRIKCDATLDELRALVRYVEEATGAS